MSNYEPTADEIRIRIFSEKENPYAAECPNRHLWSEGFRAGYAARKAESNTCGQCKFLQFLNAEGSQCKCINPEAPAELQVASHYLFGCYKWQKNEAGSNL